MKKLVLLTASLFVAFGLWANSTYVPVIGFGTEKSKTLTDTLIQIPVTVCDEDLPYVFGNQLINDPGTYWDTLQTSTGGDSIIQLNLLVKCCQSPSNTPNFADICAEAPLLCASYLDNTPFHLQNSTADIPGNLAAQFCFPIDHSRWLRFSACEPTVTLELTVQQCSGANPAQEGVEMALFSSLDCLNFSRIGNCYQTPLGQTQTMQFDGLIPGVEYYLFADGISAEVCAFRLKALSGINTGVPDDFISSGTATDGMINGDKDVCPGEIVVYTLTPPTCKKTTPEFACSPPDDACGFCGTVLELDTVTYKWHIPECARFLGDSTGLSVEIIYDQCVFFTDTVVVQQIWVEAIWSFSDTTFVQNDTLVFCDCYPGSITCGNIPPCDVRIHFDVEDVFLTIPCVGPPPSFMGISYPDPGIFTQSDVPNCLLYIIHVDKETGPPITATPPISTITCVFTPGLFATSTGQITWFPPFGFPENTPSINAYDPGVYTAVATGANGCTSSASVVVQMNIIYPGAYAGPDQVLCAEENPVQLHAGFGGPNFFYHWSNGANIPNPVVNQPIGTVNYTLTVTNVTNGCTETDNVMVTVKPPITTSLPSISLCQGDCFTVGGQLVCPTGPNSPAQVVLTSFSGCDSIVFQPFFLLPPTILQLGIIARLNCNLTQVSFHGEIYDSPGNYMVETGPCMFEAFSITQDIQTKSLTLPPETLCPGECFTFQGQTICPQPGDTPPSMLLTAVNGCDSIVTQPFVFQAPDTVQTGQVAVLNCAITTAIHHGITYSQPGVYAVQIDPCTVEQFSIGQDIQSPPPTMLSAVSVCPGDCFTFNGQTICPQPGDTPPSMLLTAANGCDSVVTQPFVFQAPDTVQTGQVAVLNCAITTAIHHGITYSQPGVYAVQTDPCTVEQFSIGQDIQSPPPTMLAAVSVCPGACFTFNGQTICPQPGDTPPSMLLTAVNGCDSIVTQPFVFQAPDTVQTGQVAVLNCAIITAIHHGVTYSQPGVYAVQIDPCTVEQFSIGQDIQSPPPTMLSAVSVCPGACFTFNGQTICPQPGDTPPSMLLTAANGCDSVVTQPFVFQAPDTVQTGQVALLNCAVTAAMHNGITYTQPGVYAVQIDPCTVEQFSIGQDIQTPPPTMLSAVSVCPGACFTFNGQTICPQPGDTPPSMLLTAANGCDSVITQPFVFQAPDTVQTGQVALLNCAVTAAMHNGITYTQPGVYAVQIDPCTVEQFSIGQDIQTPPPTMLSAVSVCPGACFTFNGQTICPQPGDTPPSMLLTAANGCDSVITQPFVFQAPDTLHMGTVARFTCVDTTFTLSGVTYTQPGDYLKQLDPCTYERFMLAKNEDECLNVYVPNVIQAESEGENGWFTIYANSGSGIQINYLRVFDRWGNQVFQNKQFLPNNPQLGWNGTLGGQRCQLGVYVYVFELQLPDGSTQVKSGDVTVIR